MPAFQLADVAISVPDGYSAKMVMLAGPSEKFNRNERPFLRNVMLAREAVSADADAESYSRQQMGLLAQQLPGFRRMGSSTVVIQGKTCPLIQAQCSGPEGMLLVQLMAYYVDAGVAHTLSASHLLGPRFDQAKNEFVEIFKSFTVGATPTS